MIDPGELWDKVKDLPGGLLAGAGAAVLGLGGKLALKLAGRFIPTLMARAVNRLVRRGLDTEHPVVKNWVKATVALAEFYIPDKGKGVEKNKLVKALVGATKHDKEMLDLIEDAVTSVDEELKKLKG